MSPSQILILSGLPGAGKTYLAKPLARPTRELDARLPVSRESA